MNNRRSVSFNFKRSISSKERSLLREENGRDVNCARGKPFFPDLTPAAARELAKPRRARIRQTTEGCHSRVKSLPPQKPRCRLQKSCQPASPCGSLSSPVLARTRAKGLRPRCRKPSPTAPLLRKRRDPPQAARAGPSHSLDHAGIAPSPALRARTSPRHAADAPAAAINPTQRREYRCTHKQ